MSRLTFESLTAATAGILRAADYLMSGSARDTRTPSQILAQETFHHELEWKAADWLRASHLRDFAAPVAEALSEACETLHAANASEDEWNARAEAIAIDMTHALMRHGREDGVRHSDPIREESARQRRYAANEVVQALGIVNRYDVLDCHDLRAIVNARRIRSEAEDAERARRVARVEWRCTVGTYMATCTNDRGDLIGRFYGLRGPKAAARRELADRLRDAGVDFTADALGV